MAKPIKYSVNASGFIRPEIRAIDRLRKRCDITRSALVRLAVREYLKRNKAI